MSRIAAAARALGRLLMNNRFSSNRFTNNRFTNHPLMRWSVPVLLEAGAWAALFLAPRSWDLAAYALLHLAATPLFAVQLWRQLPRRYRVPAGDALGFLNLLIAVLPFVGVLGLVAGLVLALRMPRFNRAFSVTSLPLPELPFQPPVVHTVPPYSGGALRQILRYADRPLKRLKAVMATRFMQVRDAVPVLQVALKDRVDDVRLLAYAMLDGKEKQLAERIQQLQDDLEEAPPARAAAIHRVMAALCWELVYGQLVHGAVRLHWLARARGHAEAALSTRADGALWVLYARIALEQNDLARAGVALRRASESGVTDRALASWCAELAFRERRYEDVARWMRMAPQGERGRRLARIRDYWCSVNNGNNGNNGNNSNNSNNSNISNISNNDSISGVPS